MSESAVVRQRIEVKDKQRRVDIGAMLLAEGYAVRPVTVKVAGSSARKYYVEYWKETNAK